MNMQDLTQDSAKGGGGSTSGGSTGTICTETSLYKATDGKIEFIELIESGQTFPPFPGGNGKKSCTWTRLSVTADGSRTSFTSVMVEAGTA